MSTLLFANLQTQRENAPRGTSRRAARKADPPEAGRPGQGVFVDAFAALIPAEVLVLHGILIEAGTKTQTLLGKSVTTITEPHGLKVMFFVLCGLSALVYVAGKRSTWDKKLDWVRMMIPPLAFIGWSILQRATMFDALGWNWSDFTRLSVGLVGAVLLGMAAAALAYKTDQSDPKPKPTK